MQFFICNVFALRGVVTLPDNGRFITAFGKVRYTLDGSDPRYSDSAKDYVAGTVLTPETGCKMAQ